jgi:hypothetical protein
VKGTYTPKLSNMHGVQQKPRPAIADAGSPFRARALVRGAPSIQLSRRRD